MEVKRRKKVSERTVVFFFSDALVTLVFNHELSVCGSGKKKVSLDKKKQHSIENFNMNIFAPALFHRIAW